MGKSMELRRISASLLLLLWIVYAKGECQYEGRRHQAGQSWKTEDCQFGCTCQNLSVFCQTLTCPDPGCDFNAGELLVFTDDDPCCPICNRNPGNCKYQGEYFPDGAKWNSSTCELCECSSGIVSCVKSSCSPLHCSEDEVPLQLKNDCCPQCLSYKKTCIIEGFPYQHGERWSPNNCMLCQCEDGRRACYVSLCPSLVCAQDEMLKTAAGECCPQCVKFQCEKSGVRHQDGDFWWLDSCTFCHCAGSKVECQRKNCTSIDSCPEDEELIQKTGYCCPTCLSTKNLCSFDDEIHYDGEIWKSAACDICLCRDGKTYCQKINCPSETCEMGELKIQKPDQCCPVCGRVQSCYFNGVIHENKDTWEKDDCTLCSCRDGKVTCFARTCSCDTDLDHPDYDKCCHACDSNSCEPLCKKCEDTNHTFCTECLETQHVLHNGRCLFDCERGYFVNENKQCQRCHDSCEKCFGGLPSQCLSCKNGEVLKRGHCVDHCGLDFFEENGKCIACHTSCSQCLGPEEDQCLSCTLPGQLLQSGRCADYCTGHFYIADGNCYACNASCERCLSDGSCQFCSEEQYLEGSTCVSSCSPGHYSFMEAYCLPCHPNCLFCYGPMPFQCTICRYGEYLLDGSCVTDCGQGYYGDQGGGVCSACHPSCHLCLADSTEDHCLSCADGYLLPYKGTSFGKCVKKCASKYYLDDDGKCEVCHETCETCFGPEDTDCLSCNRSFYLKHNRCVQHCSAGFFVEYYNTCYACHPTCSTCRGSESDNCLSCHPDEMFQYNRCVGKCGSEKFLNSHGQCQACHPTCQECIGNLLTNDTVCVRCKNQQYRMLRGHCIPKCDKNFFVNSYGGCEECHSTCASCERAGANGCVNCWEGHSLSHIGTCVPHCPLGHFDKNGLCEACDSNCFRCGENGRCELCIGQYVLQFGKCIHECSEKHYIDSATRHCKACSPGCMTCIGLSPEECSSCQPGKLLQGGACVEVCAEGYYEEEEECRMCDLKCKTCSDMSLCTSCHAPLLLLGSECVSDCGSGKYPDFETLSCLSCPSDCTYCLSPDDCGLCEAGFYLYHSKCFRNCSEKYFSDWLRRECEKNEHPPELFMNGTLTVGIGSIVPINTTVLSALDEDTDYQNIRFIVVEKPHNGALIRKSDEGDEIVLDLKQSFTMSDLLDGWIFFKHLRNVPLSGHLVLKASDRQLESPGSIMPIQVVSYHPPVVKQKEPLVAYSGTATVISPTSLLVSDRDNFEDVVLHVIQGPHHGILTQVGGRTKITKFTGSELLYRQIAYKHLGSRRKNKDAIIFRATDGYNFEFAIYTVFVVPEDAEGPSVIVNNPVYVKVGLNVKITPENLYAVDRESGSSDIVFSLQSSSTKSMGGYLSKAGGKTLRERIKKFTQSDVNRHLISYHHSDPDITNGTMKLRVTSAKDPLRHFAMIDFQIHILSSNFSPSHLDAAFGDYGMMVLENHAATLLSSHFPTRIEGLDPKDVIYEITEELSSDEGTLEHKSLSGRKIKAFSQADIANSKIVYKPPPKSVPREQFNFHFIVKDAASGFQLQPVQPFTISIIPMNNEASVTSFDHESTVVVDQGRSILLNQNILSTTGHSVPITQLEVIVAQLPEHGVLFQGTGDDRTQLEEGDGVGFTSLLKDFFYENDGSDNWEDKAIFSITSRKYTSQNLLKIVIKPVDTESPVILDSSTLMGSVTEGQFFIIKRDNLGFTDLISEDSAITFTLLNSLKHGRLEKFIRGIYKPLRPKDTFTQQDINEMFMRYKANDEVGYDTVRESVYFNVSDSSGNIQANQVMSIKIKPKVRKPPELKVLSDIQVEEGGIALFGSKIIDVTDPDSQTSALMVFVDQQPKHGFLETTRITPGAENNLLGLPISSFQYIDVLEGFINYKQDSPPTVEPTWDFFKVRVSDGHLESPVFQINVTITPTNDEAPGITVQPVLASKGRITKITNSSLHVSDADSAPSSLVITLESAPLRGKILRLFKSNLRSKPGQPLEESDSFTFQEILDEMIAYGHDNSQGMMNDNFRISVDDGLYTDSAILTVILTESDREFPFLDINRGLELDAGTSAGITSALLHASDKDSEEELLVYVITTDPSSGNLVFQEEEEIFTVLSVNGPRTVFSQEDINLRRVTYVHNVADPVGIHSFRFNVEDPAGNVLLDQKFVITIKDDVLPPAVVRNTGIRVSEGGSEIITTDHLFVNDTDSNQEKLTFEVSSGPSLGHLELRTQKGNPITRFEWTDVINQNVRYVHTSETEVFSDSFVFKVSDGKNTAIQAFDITILSIDDSLPYVVVKQLRVSEGSFKVISPFELKASDLDTKDSLILITVTTLPLHGTLVQDIEDGRNLSASSFSMEDIYGRRISYVHDGSDTVEDSFQFIVSDGTNRQFVFANENNLTTETPVVFPIVILPVDDSVPVLSRNIALKHLIFSGGQYWNGITKDVLYTTDTDTEPSMILYIITRQPKIGILEFISQPGKRLDFFKQEDIDQNFVRYILSYDDLSSTEDNFTFSVQDTGRNVLKNNIFHILWSRISFTLPSYDVSETVNLMNIGLTRSGNTDMVSFVQCKVQEAVYAKQGNDFELIHSEVAFEEKESEKFLAVRIHDDSVYEGIEEFILELSNATYALLGEHSFANIFIHDSEDEPSVGFRDSLFRVNETQKYFSVQVYRTGDASKLTSVTCSTSAMTAKGSSPKGLETGSDFRSRFISDHFSEITFKPGITQTSCDVQIIDDSFYEEEEDFELILSDPYPRAKLGNISRARIVITGPNDEPELYIGSPSYKFKENAGATKVEIVRSGPDLSRTCTVWCNTRSSTENPAYPGQDYVATSTEITFSSDQAFAECSVVILDDSPEHKVEGDEFFEVFLSNPVGCNLGKQSATTITIQDEESDVPEIQFHSIVHLVKETDGKVKIPVVRAGDLSSPASVRCITRQDTASVDVDFLERIDTDESLITIPQGEMEGICEVQIIDDAEFEGSEHFQLRLTPGNAYKSQNIRIGSRNSTVIEITDEEDVAVIYLENEHYVIERPKVFSVTDKISIGVLRSGDVRKSSKVRISTKDGSATSGTDYHAVSRQLEFKAGEKRKQLEIEIIYNSRSRWSLSFSVSLSQDSLVNAELGNITEATVTITHHEASWSSILPTVPLVVSLLHYDDVEKGLKANPSAGYPLLCVTPCDPIYPNFETTKSLCESSGINVSSLFYTWEIARPLGANGSMSRFQAVTDSTLFTSAHHKVLDSIYFRRNVWVRCVVQPRDPSGLMGVPLVSKEVKISSTNGICHTPIIPGQQHLNLQSQSFAASLSYVGSTGDEHQNSIHIRVQIPHQDGMLPLISTFPIHNVQHLLTQGDIYRHQHVCSNLHFGISADRTMRNIGFLQMSSVKAFREDLGVHLPHQFDSSLRENRTLQLYHHLNLKNCTWTFDAWYHMTELVDLCGGIITSDFKTRDSGQTFVSVHLPLYVSYVFAAVPNGWISLEHQTELESSFFYNTVLWKTGLQTEDALQGLLQVYRLGINKNGQLFFEFKTEAKFRGLFVLSHHTLPGVKSRVIPPSELPDVRYHLELLWTEQTFDGPIQLWKATSNYNLKDYSGLYVIELIPCRVGVSQIHIHYSSNSSIPCAAYNPQTFEIPLAFQQTHRPVPLIYSLNTVFQLLNNEKIFFLDPFAKTEDFQHMDYKGTFSLGDIVYGKVFWSPEQDLKSAYELKINKVIICAGANGYTPTFDPTGDTYGEGAQYGCIQTTKYIKHSFMILDRNNPDAEDKAFYDVPFRAKFWDHFPRSEIKPPGTDGFAFKVDALYKVNSGYQWFLQVMYTIGPSKRRFRRSVPSLPFENFLWDSMNSSTGIFSQSKSEHTVNGTNIRAIRLDIADDSVPVERQHGIKVEGNSAFIIVTSVLITAVVVLILVLIFIKLRIFLKKRNCQNQNTSRTQPLSRGRSYSVEPTLKKDVLNEVTLSPARYSHKRGQSRSFIKINDLTKNSESIETEV